MPDFSIEQRFGGPVCGIDEVGRGPLAGPVIAACVYIPRDLWSHPVWATVNDSKKLSPAKRALISAQIRQIVPFGLGQASVEEIDAYNILNATFMAMERAFQSMGYPATNALIDGNRAPKNFPVPTLTVIKGDALSVSIAAASIVAKVARDGLMTDLARDYPEYGWEGNAGYGTAVHLQALARVGPCPHHRRSFAPIRDMMTGPSPLASLSKTGNK